MRYKEGHIIGSTLRIVGVIGQGGFATVYEAEHLHTGRVVAIKMLDQSIDDHEQGSVLRFRQEAEIAAQLRSPSIVRVYTHGTTRHGLPWIAMERLHGVTLRHLLDRARASGTKMREADVNWLARHLLEGLAEADELGVIHRDLKPANIMITRLDGEVAQPRILDFGLSRLEGSSITARGATVGTPSHMSPEQCTGSPLDGRSDLYTLGLVLYECIAGQLPYEGATPVEAMMHHLRTSAESLSALRGVRVSRGMSAVVDRALAKSRDRRYAKATLMREALGRLRSAQGGPPTFSALLERYGVDPASVSAATGDDDGPTRHDLRVLDLPDEPGERPASGPVHESTALRAAMADDSDTIDESGTPATRKMSRSALGLPPKPGAKPVRVSIGGSVVVPTQAGPERQLDGDKSPRRPRPRRTKGDAAEPSPPRPVREDANDSTIRWGRSPVSEAGHERRKSTARKPLGIGTVKGTGLSRVDKPGPALVKRLQAIDDSEEDNTVRE